MTDVQNSMINLGNLSKPANTLIEKVSLAVGGYFKPYQIKRVAKAEAEAEQIRAASGIQINELQRRAFNRFISEETKKQENIEEITRKAIPLLHDSAKPEQLDDDWITNFFDKCRLISNDEMQKLWSMILAGEANTPGTFSKRAIDALSSLDKKEAQLFEKLCAYSLFEIGGRKLLFVYEPSASVYVSCGINFSTLAQLEAIGLIKFDPLSGFALEHIDSKTLILMYFNTPLIFEFPNEKNNTFTVGTVMLTELGIQFQGLCHANPVPGFIEYLTDYLKKNGNIVVKSLLNK